ncbi:MAG: radical SAM protein [Candidatus Aenigmatarchaeota archaeon]
MVVVKEIRARQCLTKSKLPGVDYSINPYVGCEHGCDYCYAVFMKKFTSQKGEWGEFVDVKINLHQVLRYELKAMRPGTVFLSSVCDPYQSMEGKYEITRKILSEFAKSDNGKKFEISILTKSNLCLRDIDLFQKLGCSVGFSFSSIDNKFEIGSSKFKQKIAALRELTKNKIKTYVFLGPIIPLITDTDLDNMFEEFSSLGLNHIWVDKLNIRSGNWSDIENVLKKHYPDKLDEIRKIVFGRTGYWTDIRNKISILSKKHGIKVIFCF